MIFGTIKKTGSEINVLIQPIYKSMEKEDIRQEPDLHVLE